MAGREQAAEETLKAPARTLPHASTGSAEVPGPGVGAGHAPAPAVGCGFCRLAHAPSSHVPSAAAWLALGRLLAMSALLLIVVLGILQRAAAPDWLSAAIALSLLGVVGTVARQRERGRCTDDAPARD